MVRIDQERWNMSGPDIRILMLKDALNALIEAHNAQQPQEKGILPGARELQEYSNYFKWPVEGMAKVQVATVEAVCKWLESRCDVFELGYAVKMSEELRADAQRVLEEAKGNG